MVWFGREDVGGAEIRCHLAGNLLEKPAQGIAVFTLRASINDVEGEKKVPIANVGQQRVEPLPIEPGFRYKRPPERHWLVVVLQALQQVVVVAKFGEEGARQRGMAVRGANGKIGRASCRER